MSNHVRHTLVTPEPFALERASDVITPDDDHWQYTGQFYGESIPCEDPKVFELGCNITYVGGKPIVPDTRDPFPEFQRFNVVHSDRCSILGDNTWHDVEAYAKNALLQKEGRAVEKVAWGTGLAPYVTTNSFTHLTGNDGGPTATVLNGGTAYPHAIDAVTAIEALMYQTTDDVYIHVPVSVINYLMPYIRWEESESLYRTASGSTIVPGKGYDGTAPGPALIPGNTSAYVYGTGKMKLLKGDQITVGQMGSNEVRDLGQNEVIVIAERAWGVWYDNCVGVYGANATFSHA